MLLPRSDFAAQAIHEYTDASRASVHIDHPAWSWRSVLGPIIIGAVYYAAAVLGSVLAFPAAPVSAFWAPNAVLLAALLLAPVRSWWLYCLAVLPFHILAQATTTPPEQILIQYVANCGEALIGAAALVIFERQPVRLDSLRAMGNLIVIGGIAAPFLTSCVMAYAFALVGISSDTWLTIVARTITNTFATITLVPLILIGAAYLRERAWNVTRRQLIEIAGVFLALVLVGLYVFVSPVAHSHSGSALLYAPLPLLVLASVRFGLTGACASMLLVGALATWGVLHDSGPFVSHLPVQNALATVLFLNVTSLPLLLLAAVLAEHRRSAIALARSQALHKSVLASLRDQIAVLDSRGIVLEANESWLAAPEHREGSGARVGDAYLAALEASSEKGDASCASIMEAVRDVLHGTEARLELELSVRTIDGIRWYEHSIESLQHPRRGAVITASDITARKRAEMEVQEQQQQLAHLARAAILGEFSGAIAHEIRQPLAAMLANAEAAVSLSCAEHIDKESLEEALTDIISDNLRAAQVIQRVQSMLRKTEQPRTSIRLSDLVRDSLVLTRGDLMRHHIVVKLTLDDSQPPVLADRVQIQQVLLNLIANACDAMTSCSENERVLTLTIRSYPPQHLELTVSDTGTGIDADQLEQIFEPFVTNKARGLGLGLSICRSIIAAHGGRLWAENLARGAAFHLTVPYSVNAIATEQRPAAEASRA